jgi:hypothetical protein
VTSTVLPMIKSFQGDLSASTTEKYVLICLAIELFFGPVLFGLISLPSLVGWVIVALASLRIVEISATLVL